MATNPPPDQSLIAMPSFKAMRSFIAAARYGNFTRAAEALCVTQAAISRQIRDLELHLGTELFIRNGREVTLTSSGRVLFNAAQLSLMNIFQATERIRREKSDKSSLTLCCSPALSTAWMTRRMKDFFSANPDLDLNIIATSDFHSLEPGTDPDIFLTKTFDLRPGYQRITLLQEVVYPVCSPGYQQAHPEVNSLEGMRGCALLDLNPYGRSQISEQVDWDAWFAIQCHGLQMPADEAPQYFSSNDYGLVMQMALDDQGVALGWDHLVRDLVQEGRLVRPVSEVLQLRESVLYLLFKEEKADDPACIRLRDWLVEQFG